MKPLRAIAAAACVLSLAAAAPAQADLYVDDDAPPANTQCTQADPCDTINKAVSAATAGDRIQIAAGTYEEAVGGNGLSFIGAGAGDPSALGDPARDTIVRPPPGSGTPAFSLGAPARTSVSLDGIRAYGADAAPGDPGQHAVRILQSDGQATFAFHGDVLVGGASDIAAGSALRAQGLEPVGSVQLDIASSHFGQAGTASATPGSALSVERGRATIAGSTFAPAFQATGISLADAQATLDLVEISPAAGGDTGVAVGSGNSLSGASTVTVRRSRIVGAHVGLKIDGQSGKADVRDSLIGSIVPAGAPTRTNSAAAVINGDGRVGLTAVGTTFISRGPDFGQRTGIYLHSTDSGAGAPTVGLTNSIVRAADTDDQPNDVDVHVSANSVFSASHSSYTDMDAAPFSSASAPGSDSNLTGDPGFVNEAGGDFSLSAASPLVDRGDANAVQPGELDLAGASRALDANGDCVAEPDIGAFERPAAPTCTPRTQTQPPPPDLTAPAFTSRVGLTNRRFRVGGLIARAPRGTRFHYALSEAATVRFTVERKTTGRKVGKRCVRATKKNRRRKRCRRWARAGSFTAAAAAGRNSTPWNGRIKGKALKPGSYRVRVKATDAAGNASAEQKATFAIVRR